MDLFNAANAFATIISLIGQFKSSNDSSKSQDFNEFAAWLTEQNHTELRELIEENHKTTISIKALLKLQDDKIIAILSQIESSVTTLALTIDELADLARSIHPEKELPDQALSILETLSVLRDGRIKVFRALSGPVLNFLEKPSKTIPLRLRDEKFLEDDFRVLVELGFLVSYGDSSTTVYTITRKGQDFLKSRKAP